MPRQFSPLLQKEEYSIIPEMVQHIKNNLSKIDITNEWKDYRAQILTGDGPLDILFTCNKTLLVPLRDYINSNSFSFKFDQSIFRPASKIYHHIPKTENDKIRSLWHLPKIMMYFYCFHKFPTELDSSIRFFNSLCVKPLTSFFNNINNLLRHDNCYDVRFSNMGVLFVNELNNLFGSPNFDPSIFWKKNKVNMMKIEEYEDKSNSPQSFSSKFDDFDDEMLKFTKPNED